MATQPKSPADEAPLDEQTVDLFLSNMGTDMVLVGGQALAFWMDRFKIEQHGGMAISNDGDALGKVACAIDLARAMQARVELPAVSAPLVVEAAERMLQPSFKRSGALALGEAFDAKDFLNAIKDVEPQWG